MNPGKINKIIAAAIFIIMFPIYLMTVAPTISFWDCGEFVTCSYIMGIPHPPGSPLLSLIGRIMSLIPFYDIRGHGFGEIAYRVNMIDVILGALTVMLTYLIFVKLIHKFRAPSGRPLDEYVIMFSAALTAFMVGFSDEFWTNAVEIETYMPSLFMSMLAVWLTLHWDEHRDNPRSILYLFLGTYIIGLGNGIHPLGLLITPTVFLFILFSAPHWFARIKFWVFSFVFLLVVALIKLYGGLALFYFSMAVFALVAPALLYRFYRREEETWKIAFLGVVFCFSLFVIGYSVYPTVMVRASKKPTVNENNPDNWERYKLYMSREQYGQENMYLGIFSRNADARYQFSYMYLRYLIMQFPKWGPSLPLVFENDKSPDSTARGEPLRMTVYLPVLLMVLLLYGLYTHGSEDWRRFIALLLFFIASSIGLVLYLNMENPQVRERPYFFIGSFYIIMYWLGIGVYGIITDILDWLRDSGKHSLVKPATVVLFIIFATMPPTAVLSNHINPDFTNYDVHNRTGDWASSDYGHNILVSCEPNAILFTNGDNDTFPLWYLQEVENFRRDVRVVNLSLLNTPWYILQMKHEGEEAEPIPVNWDAKSDTSRDGLRVEVRNVMKTIPIGYSDEYIEDTLCGREDKALMTRIVPVEGKELKAAGITWTVKPNIQLNNQYGMVRIQTVMVANIINWVDWKRPLYFAVTVSDYNKAGLQDYLSMEGMVYRLVREKGVSDKTLVDIPALDRNIFDRYQYHALSDPEIYKPSNTLKLTTNYFIGFAQLAQSYAIAGNLANTVRASWGAINMTPHDLQKRLILYQVFLRSPEFLEGLREFLEWEYARPGFKNGREGTLDHRLKIASYFDRAGDKETTLEIVRAERDRLNLDDYASKTEFGARLLALNMNDAAYDYFKDLVESEPETSELMELFAATMYATGRYDEALDTLDRLLEKNPGDESTMQTRNLLIKLIEESKNGDSVRVRFERK